jgi:hypothetical protein
VPKSPFLAGLQAAEKSDVGVVRTFRSASKPFVVIGWSRLQPEAGWPFRLFQQSV